MASGEVLLNGPQLGTPGISGWALSNLLDANNLTAWNTNPVDNAWAGQDAGVPCTLTRVRITAFGGFEDDVVGSQIQGSSDPAFPSPESFAQGSGTHATTAVASIVKTYTLAQTAGNSNVIFIDAITGFAISGVTDISGNTYNLLAAGALSGIQVAVYVATGIAAASAGTNVVTVAFSTSASNPDVHILEYKGLVTVSILDGSMVFVNGGPDITASATITTSNANDIIIAKLMNSGAPTVTASGGDTIRVNENPTWGAATADNVVSSAGSQTVSFSMSSSQTWWIFAIALKLTGAGPTVLKTIANRPVSGTLLNEYTISSPPSFQYFRYQSPGGTFGSISDLDFIAKYTSGIIAQCVAPTISPSIRQSDLPLVVSLSCITTDATMYYTLDGTTPTTASTLYTGPFAISSSCTFNAISVSAGLSNSRVTSTQFTIPSAIISTNPRYDDRNRSVWDMIPHILHDPVSGWWYLYGNEQDQVGANYNGYMGINVYKSADLRNWTFVANLLGPPAGQQKNAKYFTCPNVLYNALNNNYVCWVNSFQSGGGIRVFTSPTPAGPFTLVGNYTTVDGQNTSNEDQSIFVDIDGVTAYLVHIGTGNSVLSISQLNAAYTNVTGTHVATYNSVATFGQLIEGPTLFYWGGTYFLMFSGTANWTPNTNYYVTGSSPIGPWSSKVNPFQPTTNPDSLGPGSGVVGITVANSYTIAFDSQVRKILQIPGRGNNPIFMADRFDTGTPPNIGTDPTANLERRRLIQLPITFPTSSTMQIIWQSAWTFDGTFPAISGAPTSASNLIVTDGYATWTNNESNPANVYLDTASDPSFTINAVSQFINPGSSTANALVPNTYYRIRTVNANGSSMSQYFRVIVPAVYLPGGISPAQLDGIQRKWNERNTDPNLPIPVN